jgi:galactosylceramidase
MNEAKKRNKNILLDVLAWGAPAWIGDGNYYSDDLPEYMAKFLLGAKRVHNLDIDYIGIWNERPYNVDYIKQLKKTLNNYNLKTKIVAADEIRSYRIAKDMLKDPELYNVIDVIGTHYPQGQGEELFGGKSVYDIYGKDYKIVWKEALDCGKPIWAQEDGPWNGEWNGAKGLIKALIRNYIDAKMVKTITWSLISSYHDSIGIPASGLMRANTPWSGQYEVQPALWAMAHVTQFVEPGWFYLEGGANGYLKNGGSYTSLVSPDKQDVSVIIETVEALDDESVTFNLIGNYANKQFYLWKTDSVNYFTVQHNIIKPSNGSLTLTLDKGAIYTLTTTTGQKKGNEDLGIPKAANFHLPYYDDFESYEVDKLPRYTSDISGVFEVENDKKKFRTIHRYR